MKDKEDFRLTKRAKTNLIQIILLASVAAIFTVSGFIVPLRPTFSETEKRELSKFPSFSFSSLFDGSYFHGIDAWYSDTFPLREMWIGGNAKLKELYGFSSQQIHGQIQNPDEIPDITESQSVPEESTDSVVTDTSAPETTVPVSETTEVTQKTPPNNTQSLGAVLIADNCGYEYYNFALPEANRYSAAISRLSQQLKGNTKLYAMVVPTSIGITLDDSIKSTINSSDQKKAIDYIYSKMNGNINKVNAYDNLLAHRNEYVYFKTDHHWTALGAYYAYEKYIEMSGKPIVPIGSYTTKEFKGFLGSFYTDTGKNPKLEKNPDTVIAYLPTNNASLVFTDKSGKKISWSIITDVTDYNTSYKYLTFIGGDNPYSVIKNSDLTDGSSCLVVKESFGNALVPFLVANYQTVHIIDYRYYNGKIADFVAKNGVQDVLFINNISATRSKTLVSDIEKVIG